MNKSGKKRLNKPLEAGSVYLLYPKFVEFFPTPLTYLIISFLQPSFTSMNLQVFLRICRKEEFGDFMSRW